MLSPLVLSMIFSIIFSEEILFMLINSAFDGIEEFSPIYSFKKIDFFLKLQVAENGNNLLSSFNIFLPGNLIDVCPSVIDATSGAINL
ncbi:hypothetical protein [Chryseobacterium sp. SL1]|uniref:hypothetical protein n=1 Tax=Chryseobacterium sp. SL1 TaxID=2995159 RepID=UPI00227AB08C|nr:hypothetical protein [Chryseobacterium sp. SL1]